MRKEVLFGADARKGILAGVNKIVDAIKVTMGASGKTVLIGNAFYGNDGLVNEPTIITKDGYTCAKHFQLSDQLEQRGAMLVKEAAFKTVEEAGDATTATTVLAGALINGGMKLVDEGANSQEVKKGIDKAVELFIQELKEIAVPVAGDNNRILQVATVSANNDAVIGKYIADAYEKIGHDGVIDVTTSNGLTTNIKVADGFKFDKGWVSPLFVTNKAKEIVEFEEPLILLYDKRINHHSQVEAALNIAIQRGRPMLIICEDAEGQGLAFLGMNNVQQRIRVCVVKSPSFGDERRDYMEDMAKLTGGSYISDLNGFDIKEVIFNQLGSAKKVIVTKEETVIIGGQGVKDDVDELVNDLKMNLAEAKTQDDKAPIEKRIARLTGGVAVIEVGAATESELGEKLDRYDDAIRSAKSSISDGIVAGGGTAMLRIAERLAFKKTELTDFEKGQQLVAESLLAPLKQIAENAGLSGDAIFMRVSGLGNTIGYNVKSGQVEDLMESGIIDSAKALRCALVNAASVAGAAITSETVIITVS